MMDELVFFCKTTPKDFHHLVKLSKSIQKYNIDNIPVYICTREENYENLATLLNEFRFNFISEEEILKSAGLEHLEDNWITQQIVKLLFSTKGNCKNYLCLDSDSYFIRNFYISDFIIKGIALFQIHQQKDLFEWALEYPEFYNKIKSYYISIRKPVMDYFKRAGEFYDFGPAPILFNSEICIELIEHWRKSDLTIEKAFIISPSEFTWYGEFILYKKTSHILPRQPFFKVFHYAEQYLDFTGKIPLSELDKEYLGVVLQSTWLRNPKGKNVFSYIRKWFQ